jgi:FMN-dependent NADH-azoreductase
MVFVEESSQIYSFLEVGKPFFKLMKTMQRYFGYLANQVITLTCDNKKQIITTKGSDVLSNMPIEERAHKEAYTRHLFAHAARLNNTNILVRTVDTDAVVIATTAF